MKKIALFAGSCLLINTLFAQDSTFKKKKEPINLSGRANDHFIVQFGYTGWAGKPDSVNTSGFSKSFNAYFMFDFPFKTNPKLSMAIGAGISSDHIIFKETYVGIKDITLKLQFTDQSDTNHFKKTKLNTTYFEAPLEFRYTAKPLESNNSFKFAVGVKVGALISAHTRNVDFENKNDNSLNDYTMKEKSKRFFNTTRLVGAARVGFGPFSVYGSYQITALFKEGFAAEMRPYSIGLTLSGL
jgi:hypothetical protein